MLGTRKFVLLLAFLLLPALAMRAQFQQPTDEELKMTTDPKAPGADAVCLYREEIDDGHNHSSSFYVRIKVLTERGKELATVHVLKETLHYTDVTGFETFDVYRVTDIKGRTIHPDGTVIELNTKEREEHPGSDVAAQKTDTTSGTLVFSINQMEVDDVVFTLPSMEVGSILEYRYVIRNDEHYDNSVIPTWQIQQPYFIHRAHFEFHPWNIKGVGDALLIQNEFEGAKPRTYLNPTLIYSAVNVPASDIKQVMNARYANDSIDRKARDYTLDLTDIPPEPREDWMPPLNTVNMRVQFYQSYAVSGKEFWDSETRNWASDVGRFIHANKDLPEAAAGIIQGAATDEEKARMIYDAVMKLDNTDFSRSLSEAERQQRHLRPIRSANDVWNQKSGTGNELALLYVALARAAGLPAWPMFIVNRDRALFDYYYASTRQLDDYVVVMELGGKDVYLDPGQAMCPFGQLHWKHTLAAGFRLTENGAVLASTPASVYTNAVTRRLGDLTIAPDGSVTGGIRIEISGPLALRWRQMALLTGPDEARNRFDEYLRGLVPAGVSVKLSALNGLDKPNQSLSAMATVSGPLASTTGAHLIVPGQFFSTRTRQPFISSDQRKTPIDVHYAALEQDDVTYHLPAGMTAQSLPQADDSWPNHAIFKVASSAQEDAVNISRQLVHSFTVLDAKEYGDLHGFYQNVDVADTQPLVLAHAAETKGN
jgi:hypothetical protein